MNQTMIPITPADGYILARPHIQDTGPFKSVKETDGLDQLSEVLAVSEKVLDNNNIERICPVRVGQIIYHAYSNKEFEKEFTKYRFVHFSEIHGILKEEANEPK